MRITLLLLVLATSVTVGAQSIGSKQGITLGAPPITTADHDLCPQLPNVHRLCILEGIVWDCLGTSCTPMQAGGDPTYKPAPKPEWVPDPSAGHYDCPDGWLAMQSVEPEVWKPPYWGPTFNDTIPAPPSRDKKGHVLGYRPPPPICVQEPKP